MTWTWPARLEQIKTRKILKYGTGRSHILIGQVCKMTPSLRHLKPWFLSLSSYSLIGRMLQLLDEGVASRWTHKVWLFTKVSGVTNFPSPIGVQNPYLESYFIFCLSFLSVRTTYGACLLIVTLAWLKCHVRVTSTQFVGLIKSWALYYAWESWGNCK